MMTSIHLPELTGDSLALRRGALPRTVLEAGLGCGLLLVLGRLLALSGGSVGPILAGVPDFLGLLWITAWPAWRLRPLHVQLLWPARIGLGIARAILVGVLLMLIGTLLVALIEQGRLALPLVEGILFWFVVLRGLIAAGSVVERRARRRLRWQLTVSHAAVIVLTLVTLTSLGTLVGLGAAAYAVTVHPAATATSVADDLQLAGSTRSGDQRTADQVIRLIYARRLPLRGEPALAGLVPAPFLPKSIALVDLQGRVIDGRVLLGSDGKRTRRTSSWSDVTSLTPARQEQLQRLARAGHTGQMKVPGADRSGSPEVVAVAPVRDSTGKIASMVVVRVAEYRPTASQFPRFIVTVFGVTTVAVILVTALPMLGLSLLFSYLVSRGLTQGIEALSGVTRSIASGDLTRRAPVATRNEVGQLAEDVNRMADHLESAMGELRGARATAEEALRLRQELIANISHELRTPLAVIRAHLETANMAVPAGSTAPAEAGDVSLPPSTLAALREETERLAGMVDDLFALSRAQAGAIELQSQPVDVVAVVHEIGALMKPLAQREGSIALSAETPPGPMRAMADPDRLRQILSNLVRNAVRYTPDGGIIVLSVSAEASWVVISVADTGEGIAPEHLPHVFDRFYRADPARSRVTGGAGLGLAIVRELTELMGGHVEVESSLGEGTRFRVFLPAA